VEVEDHDLGPQSLEGGQPCLTGQLAGHLVAEVFEVVPDGSENVDVVVDQQYRIGHGFPGNAV
jgi:hypothetical protein